ncbi:ASCH domain protein [Acetobacter malorum]|uniref:ASCH domain protein n=1 Tax=Acetobacter malorum TaxID=178901 RepID=A0A177G757_9PROT|nr:ASCH domain-containing protein [Acetobacter malorum]OAG75631.1 ASCH domain protein [Acetobacter malorum]
MIIDGEKCDRGLVIDAPWIDLILDQKKKWEMRTKNTKIRGRIGLIRKGTGKIFGTATLFDCFGPLNSKEFKENSDKHCIPPHMERECFQRGWVFAWCLKDIFVFTTPVSYEHKIGAVTWVKLN